MSEIEYAWNAIRVILQKPQKFTFYEIKDIVGLAGFDMASIAHLKQEPKAGKPGASKGQLMTAIDRGYGNLTDDRKKHFISVVVEEILRRNQNLEDELIGYLNRLGLTITNGTVVPIKLLDHTELAELPEETHKDLVKAGQRFRDGDLSGAVSSACGAVDNVISQIYSEGGLGDVVGKASFQERCRVAINKRKVISQMEKQLRELGWDDSIITPFKKNFEGALNQAAYVMQTLRSKMSDVHGTKPVLKPLVFDSIKWAELLVRVLNEK
jgi:hypothetical protein